MAEKPELKEVERSPDGRYIRFDEKLGTGAYKAVWLAYDTERGIEVAWNLVDFRRVPPREKERLRSETDILKTVNHENIINFYNVWEVVELEQVVFITERVVSGSLKQYIKRLHPVRLQVVKRWCRQILLGLIYLHSRPTPIIHRDLKCDNVFINGNSGDIRIGDLGLASMRNQTHAVSVLGTPEFMAPELYDEYYNEKVDIYAFGMCLLEMITNEYPYEECSNAAQIFKRVSQGIMPDAVARVSHTQTRQFIMLCIAPESIRLSAFELLRHPFLSFKQSDYRDRFPAEYTAIHPEPARPSLKQVTSQQVLFEGVQKHIARVVFRIHIGDKRKEIKFDFDMHKDTAEAVAAEMVKELQLASAVRVKLANGIFKCVKAHRLLWKQTMRDQPESYEGSASSLPAQPETAEHLFLSANAGPSANILDFDFIAADQEHVHLDTAPATEEKQVLQLNANILMKELRDEALAMSEVQLRQRLADLGADPPANKSEMVLAFVNAKLRHTGLPVSAAIADLGGSLETQAASGPKVRADADFIKLVMEHPDVLSETQRIALCKIDQKRESKLQMQKNAYLKSKRSTNREFNAQALQILQEWGLESVSDTIPKPSAEAMGTSSRKQTVPKMIAKFNEPARKKSLKKRESDAKKKPAPVAAATATAATAEKKKTRTRSKPDITQDVTNIEEKLTQPFFVSGMFTEKQN